MTAVEVRALLRERVMDKLAPRGSAPIGDDDSLTDCGYLDSLTIFQLIAFVEDSFSVRVADDEITLDNFGTIGAVARLVAGKLDGRRA